MEKVSSSHRRQTYTPARGVAVIAVALLCYAWFAWQLRISPAYLAAFVVALVAIGFVAGILEHRRKATVLLEVLEIW